MGNITKTFHLGIGLGAKLLAGLGAVKLCAEYLGAQGFGMTGQLSSLLSIVTLLAGAGTSVGVTKIYASNELTPHSKVVWVNTARVIALLSAVVLLISIVGASGLIVDHLLLDLPGAWWLVGALAIGVFPIANSGVAQGIINGMHRNGLYAISLTLGALLGFAGVWIGARYFGAIGALIGVIWLPVAQSLMISIIGRQISEGNETAVMPEASLRKQVKFFLGYGLLYIAPGIIMPVAYILIRLLIQENNGFEVLSFWQAALRMSDAYCQLPMLVLSVVLFPKIASLDSGPLPREFLKKIYLYVTVLTGTITFIVFLTYDIWLNIIFTTAFKSMREYMPFQMLGDVLRITSYVGTTILAAQGRIKLCLLSEMLQATLLLVFSALLISSSNPFGMCYAYIITYCSYLLFTWFFMLAADKTKFQNACL